VLVDQLKPQVDLQATYGLAGLGGTSLVRNAGASARTGRRSIPGGLGDTFSTLFRNDYPRWTRSS
jgi:hypothetical protein